MFAPTTAATAPADPAIGGRGDTYLTSSQVVDRLASYGLQVTERRVRGWIKRGVLEGSNPERGVWLVTTTAIDTWIQKGRPVVTPAAAPRGRRLPEPDRIDATQGRRRPSRRAARSTDLNLV